MELFGLEVWAHHLGSLDVPWHFAHAYIPIRGVSLTNLFHLGAQRHACFLACACEAKVLHQVRLVRLDVVFVEGVDDLFV